LSFRSTISLGATVLSLLLLAILGDIALWGIAVILRGWREPTSEPPATADHTHRF